MDEVDNQHWLDLLAYKPTHAFIHVGGNDTSSTSTKEDVFLPIRLWCRNCGNGMYICFRVLFIMCRLRLDVLSYPTMSNWSSPRG